MVARHVRMMRATQLGLFFLREIDVGDDDGHELLFILVEKVDVVVADRAHTLDASHLAPGVYQLVAQNLVRL
jgi:hypothetical protein